MKFQKVNIATAKIEGLNNSPYYFDNAEYYVCDIYFNNSTSLNFYNLTCIKVGNTREEGVIFSNQIKENFKQAHINEGDRVSIMFSDDGDILAIGSIGENAWIDVNDNFKKKTFEELNIVITSLTVY